MTLVMETWEILRMIIMVMLRMNILLLMVIVNI